MRAGKALACLVVFGLALGGDWQTDNFKVAIEVVRGWNLNLSAAGFNSIKYFLILESAK